MIAWSVELSDKRPTLGWFRSRVVRRGQGVEVGMKPVHGWIIGQEMRRSGHCHRGTKRFHNESLVDIQVQIPITKRSTKP